MNWNVSRQNAVTVQLIFLLYMQMDSGRTPRTQSSLTEILKQKSFSTDRIGHALSYLLNDKLAYKDGDGYRLTSTGAHWVEYNFEVENVGDQYTFTPLHNTITIGQKGAFRPPAARPISNASTADWTKWGALASLVAIPVAVILWWFS